MEYHVSSNNSLHYYEDLKHNTAIPSRLGYNLKVVIATDNQTQAEVSANLMFFLLINSLISNECTHKCMFLIFG